VVKRAGGRWKTLELFEGNIGRSGLESAENGLKTQCVRPSSPLRVMIVVAK